MKTPDWVTEIMNKHVKEADDHKEQGKESAWQRMGGAAPGEPDDLAKPKVPGNVPKWNSKTRGLDKPPCGHLDDHANFDDGKDNKTRPISTFARFPTTGGGRSKSQLHRWCVCDQSKDADNKESPTYPATGSARRATRSRATRTRTRAWMARYSTSSRWTRPRLRPPPAPKGKAARPPPCRTRATCRRGGPQARRCPHRAPQGPDQKARRITRR